MFLSRVIIRNSGCNGAIRSIASIQVPRDLANADSSKSTDTKTSRRRLVDLLKTSDTKKVVVKDPRFSKQSTNDARTKYVTDIKDLKFYEPPYLVREAPFPNYNTLNINIKGYNYTVLNIYHDYVTNLCKLLNVKIVESYPMPLRTLRVQTLQPFSSKVDQEYTLYTYHRVVKITGLKSTLAPILFESIQLNLPEGVQLSIKAPIEEEEQFRYVPDVKLNELKKQLEEITKKPSDSAASTTANPVKK